jgi:hypothetical protein
MLAVAVTLQIVHVLYHQVTTLLDFFPFNGVRFYSTREKILEAGINLVLMSLPPIGFIFRIHSLMTFGVVYYFVLLTIEFFTWWKPYFFGASQKWIDIHSHIHSQTITVLPRRRNNPAPNLEHLILDSLSFLTAIATLAAYCSVR